MAKLKQDNATCLATIWNYSVAPSFDPIVQEMAALRRLIFGCRLCFSIDFLLSSQGWTMGIASEVLDRGYKETRSIRKNCIWGRRCQ